MLQKIIVFKNKIISQKVKIALIYMYIIIDWENIKNISKIIILGDHMF